MFDDDDDTGFDLNKYIREKELKMKGFTPEKIQQLFAEDCIEWRDDAQRRAKTGHRQDHLGYEIESRSRNMYQKLLWVGEDRQNLKRLHEREVEKQERQRVEEYELKKQRREGFQRLQNRQYRSSEKQSQDQAWENVINRRHTVTSRHLREMDDTMF